MSSWRVVRSEVQVGVLHGFVVPVQLLEGFALLLVKVARNLGSFVVPIRQSRVDRRLESALLLRFLEVQLLRILITPLVFAHVLVQNSIREALLHTLDNTRRLLVNIRLKT